MNDKKIKSGQDILNEFFSGLVNIKGIDQGVANSIKRLYDEDKLTNINLSNELLKIREGK